MLAEQPTTSVADYLGRINALLASQYGRVRGEVTSISQSGKAIYFTIKDTQEAALLKCLIWSSLYDMSGLQLREGDEIIVSGIPDIYPNFGTFTFKADTIAYAGEGALKRDYERLKATLQAEGLLAPERKRALPAFPRKIGVITSKHGVVLQDFSTNLNRRGYQIRMIDSRVEGKDAIHDLQAALRTMARRDIEVLVIMRGGGSWESLQAFNNEAITRLVAGFKVPVVTGIGHDTDVTLVQMVADVGRSTPTAVAEALNEPWDSVESNLQLLQHRTLETYASWLSFSRQQVMGGGQQIFRVYERRLAAAQAAVQRTAHAVSTSFLTLANRVREVNTSLQQAVALARATLRYQRTYLQTTPQQLNRAFWAQLHNCQTAAERNFKRACQRQRLAVHSAGNQLAGMQRTIHASDPQRMMRLGYSLSFAGAKLLRTVKDVPANGSVTTRLADGEFTSEVKRVK